MWPNCLGAVKKAGIRCPHQLVVGGDCDGVAAAAAGAVLSTFYVLILYQRMLYKKIRIIVVHFK